MRVVMCLLSVSSSALAEDPKKTDKEILIPPMGGTADVPIHAGTICILEFPEALTNQAITTDISRFEIQPWRTDGLAIHSIDARAPATTIALSTKSGSLKVNVTLRVVGDNEPALTFVRFKSISTQDEWKAAVAAEVAKRTSELQGEVDTLHRSIDTMARDRVDAMFADRALQRMEVVKLEAHERNSDQVIAHVRGASLLGPDAVLVYEIENRSTAAYRLANVRVFAGGKDVAGPARLAGAKQETGLVGVVPPGMTARGGVVVRSADQILGKPLVLELAGPMNRGTIRIEKGLVLR
ncbi:MAG TPA: hypothetical protein VGM88_20375 [Kofleriaceae bacterium]